MDLGSKAIAALEESGDRLTVPWHRADKDTKVLIGIEATKLGLIDYYR